MIMAFFISSKLFYMYVYVCVRVCVYSICRCLLVCVYLCVCDIISPNNDLLGLEVVYFLAVFF